jgi:hypothetical protein
MATVQSSSVEEQSFLARFAELAWLDRAISFIFKLIAILAEPFLAFGLVASAIDYGSHGKFLSSNEHLMLLWTVTQALALEGSGGSVLALSFDADKEGDHVKAWIQRLLAIALMLTGGIMFFAEMAEAVPGFKGIIASGGYVYAMAGLRSLVSLGYLAVCRTRSHRYSGVEPAQQPAPAPDIEAEVAHAVESAVGSVRNGIQDQLDELRNAVQGSIAELPAQIKAAAQDLDYEVDPEALSAQVNETVAHCLRTLDLSAQIKDRVEQVVAMAVMRPVAQPTKHTDELAPKNAQPKETTKIPAITEKGLRIQRYIAEQRQLGKEPTLDDIMADCECAKNTAVQWRKAMEVA